MLRFLLIIICLIFLSCDGNKSSFNQINDCVGDSVPIDCSDTTIPGCAYINNCGICVGGGSTNNDISDCCPLGFSKNFEDKCVPNDFLYPVISTVGAGYLFQLVQIEIEDGLNQSISSTNCIDANDCDWVGAFNGNICVGANQWNTDDCLGNICEVFVFGYDYNSSTEEYMNDGEHPTFKIYDASENMYYNTLSLGNEYPWGYQVIHTIPLLLGQP